MRKTCGEQSPQGFDSQCHRPGQRPCLLANVRMSSERAFSSPGLSLENCLELVGRLVPTPLREEGFDEECAGIKQAGIDGKGPLAGRDRLGIVARFERDGGQVHLGLDARGSDLGGALEVLFRLGVRARSSRMAPRLLCASAC